MVCVVSMGYAKLLVLWTGNRLIRDFQIIQQLKITVTKWSTNGMGFTVAGHSQRIASWQEG